MIDGSLQVTRVSLGTMIGVLFGLGGFVLVPMVVENGDPWLRWGILLWYPTLGAAIGAISRVHLIALPDWLLGALVGGWLTVVLIPFAHDEMTRFMESAFGSDSTFVSPFWFVPEGAMVGAAIGFVVDRFATE